MFDHLGWGEMSVLLVLALFVFGPDRLPGLARDLGRGVRKTKALLRGMTDDLKSELGPEVGDLDLRSLHPKTFVADLMRDDDDDLPAGPVAAARPLQAGEPAPWDPDTT